MHFADHATVLSVLIAQLFVIATSAKYVSICLPFCIAAVWLVQKFYLRTSLQLRILDIESKSRLFTHFLELLSGITTIRAFGWERQHLLRARAALATSQRPFYLLYCIQRWLNLVLNLIVGAVAVLLVTVAVKFRGSSDAGLIGLALVTLVGFTQILKQLVTNWTLLETSAGAVSRIRSFTADVKSENLPNEYQEPPEKWPSKGAIEFQNITASHG